jgi:putative ABC transport system permease protein
MLGWIWDVRHAFRLHRASPVSSGMAILVLALAFAFVCVFLALWSELALKSHRGFESAARLVSIGQYKGDRVLPVNSDFINDVRETVPGMEALAGVMLLHQEVSFEGEERSFAATELVTRDYFPGLRPRVLLGRGFDIADHQDEAERVVIISHAYWQRRFGGRSEVLGQPLTLLGPGWSGGAAVPDTKPFRIVGVMAPELPSTFGGDTELWLPFERGIRDLFPGIPGDFGRMATLLTVGATVAGADVESIRADLVKRYPRERAEEFGLRTDYALDAVPGVVRDIGSHLDALRHVRLALASMVLVMVVAACNLSLFLLAQAPRRRKELGIRVAVGAPMRRIARQLATESLMLTGAAAVLGVLLSLWLTGMVSNLAVFQHVRLEQASPLDWRVMGAAFIAMLALALLVSIAPVAMARRTSIAASSRDDGGDAAPWQRLAGAAQVAVATVLACVALAISWHLYRLAQLDRGFDDRDVLVVDVSGSGFSSEHGWEGLATSRGYRRRILESIPGIEGVAFGSPLPGQRITFATSLASQVGEPRPVRAVVVSADAAFPEVLGLRLLQGRFPQPDEPQAVLVNEALAMELWGRVDVTGNVIPLPALRSVKADGDVSVTVAGVVRDVTFAHPSQPVEPTVFTPLSPTAEMDSVVVRTRMGPAELQEVLQANIDHGGLDVRVNRIDRLQDIWRDLMAADRARTLVAVLAAMLVLVLSIFGFYGTLLYLVSAARREFAVHAAMGAGPSTVRRMVIRRGLSIAAPGLFVGAIGGFAAVGALRGGLIAYTMSPVLVVAVVISALLVVVVTTSAFPARRAARVLPAQALREGM